ncbi:protease modulator HflK [Novosphingobium cyanobacteriorum]|uniref:Protease modulator HflK n=1 Tax=Novosphingobium cyanobacteriorum TaxID=3024215 RepID=A0ABT6CHD7_9SPHN|nr:protease modulator HflK [Novosphingobium cyanobacteriorum]MDF8333196.1 protease modulator HflK [Novosphingobium cyanobacteriorum]
MSSFGERAKHSGWAMAGKNSPWGGSGGEGGSGPEEPSTPDGESPPASPPPAADQPGGKPGDKSGGPRNPWLPPSAGGDNRRPSLEDIFRKRGGGGGGNNGGRGGPNPQFRLPQRPDGKSWTPLVVAAVLLLWLGTSMVHRVSAQEEGVVTTFGSYSRTLKPGMALTAPWPFQAVTTENVTQIRRESIPEGDAEKLMLTSDQNLVDLSYIVRWNIKDLKLYSYQLADPDQTVREVAEAAMRQSISEVSLGQVMGSGRAAIETSVRDRMQRVLDAYRAGVTIQGVDIKKTDPPTKVVDAFKEVLAAQQDAQSEINRANAWAQQLTARAQGEAAAFDKVYAQYKLAPEVTRRRMYYETMERVLSQTDKVIVEAPGTVPYLPLPAMKQTPPPAPVSEAKP